MKIVMIGPVYPYRGGMAHFTSLMTKALLKKHDVTMISYSKQYPKILYPRTTQYDYENPSLQIEPTHYLLNTVNPITYIKTARFIKKLKPDLVIFQWWHPFFTPSYWSINKLIRMHCKIIFACLNFFPHEKFPMQRMLTKAALSTGHAFIVQSKTDEKDLLAAIPNAVYRRTVLQTFNAFNFTNISRTDARKIQNIADDSQVLLFFGFVREYKGLKYLLTAMPKIIKSFPKCKLLIVGDILDNEKEDYKHCIEQTGCKDNIKLVSEYVPDKDIENYFTACDLVVLPYEHATQSGISQLAFGFKRPIVSTDVGGLPEAISDGKTGYIVPPQNSDALADAVIRFFAEGRAEEFKQNIENEAHRFSWESLVRVVEELHGEISAP